MTFQKGHKQFNSGKTHFKNGSIPWNKNKMGVMPIPWNKRLTKETDERVKNNVEKAGQTNKRLFAEGRRKTWNQDMPKEEYLKHFPNGIKGIFKKGSSGFTGTHTIESRRKMSDKLKGRKVWNKNLPCSEKAKEKIRIARAKQVFPIIDSSIEVKIQTLLREASIEFLTHQFMHIEHGYQCDIIIPSMKLVIECDGDYWHGNPLKNKELNEKQIAQREMDNFRTKELQESGFKVVRLWENEIKQLDLNRLLEIIKNV